MTPKILTVDDSKMVRLIVARAFMPYGCEVYEAGNGADGLATAAAILPDLIFLDITMSDMNGLVLLENLRQVPELAAIPVVMLTAESGIKAIQRADELKVIGYIPKPFKGEQLLALASKIIPLQPLVAH
jgi:two-component system cell cycle response regulator